METAGFDSKADMRTEETISGYSLWPPGNYLNPRAAQAVGWDPVHSMKVFTHSFTG